MKHPQYHDWLYHMTEDHKWWSKMALNEDRLKELADTPEKKELFNQYRKNNSIKY